MIISHAHIQYNFDSKLNRNEKFNRLDTLRFGNYNPNRWILGFNDPVFAVEPENQFTGTLGKVANGIIYSYYSTVCVDFRENKSTVEEIFSGILG